jgi:hypothetical protein
MSRVQASITIHRDGSVANLSLHSPSKPSRLLSNRGAKAPVNAVSLVKQTVEGTEGDIFRTSRVHSAKSKRSIFRAYRLNPFVESVVVAGKFGHRGGGKTSVQKFIVGIDTLRVEIFRAEFACKHHGTIHNCKEWCSLTPPHPLPNMSFRR